MARLLKLPPPNGDYVDPCTLSGLRTLAGGRLIGIDEFGKLAFHITSESDAVARAYMEALKEVTDAGTRWVQPDWDEIRRKVLQVTIEVAKTPNAPFALNTPVKAAAG